MIFLLDWSGSMSDKLKNTLTSINGLNYVLSKINIFFSLQVCK